MYMCMPDYTRMHDIIAPAVTITTSDHCPGSGYLQTERRRDDGHVERHDDHRVEQQRPSSSLVHDRHL